MSGSFIWPAVRCWPVLLFAVGCMLLASPARRALADGALGLAAAGADAIRGVGPLVELDLEDGGTVVLTSILVPDATRTRPARRSQRCSTAR